MGSSSRLDRRTRLTALGLAVLAPLALLFAHAHDIVVVHEVCEVHGEWTHASARESGEHAAEPATLEAGGRSDTGAHDHCPISHLTREELVLWDLGPPHLAQALVDGVRLVEPGVFFGILVRYRLAPKQSPPV